MVALRSTCGHYYRQYCAKRKAPVFNLLRPIVRFFCPAGATRCTDGGEI